MVVSLKTRLRKQPSNWVDGDQFFDRDAEIEALKERVREGTHTLLTAQRRMGKTSLVRELLRQLNASEDHETLFVDLEAADTPADAVTEIAAAARSISTAWERIRSGFANFLEGIGNRIEAVEAADLKVRLRSGIDSGSWDRRGDEVFSALADIDKPVVLAIDELPILVNRLLKGHDYRITSERRASTDLFLSWLRRNGQTHRGKIVLIVSGSIGLDPILSQARLSAHANIFSSFELKPWDQETSLECLDALARWHGVNLSIEVRRRMCGLLRCCIPQHIQQFFDHLHEHLRRETRYMATVDDVDIVYYRDLLSVRGQISFQHYEERLRTVMGSRGYTVAISILTEASVNDGLLTDQAARSYQVELQSLSEVEELSINDVLHLLEHDGYLERQEQGYSFVSGLLQDWWLARHGRFFTPISER